MKNRLQLFAFFSVIFLSFSARSQGTTCASATSLSVHAGCVTEPWTNTENGNLTWDQPCGTGTDYQDVWYKVTGTGGQIGVNIFHMNSPDLVLAVYPSCPTPTKADRRG